MSQRKELLQKKLIEELELKKDLDDNDAGKVEARRAVFYLSMMEKKFLSWQYLAHIVEGAARALADGNSVPAGKGSEVLPVLICAKNEAAGISTTLESILSAARVFQRNLATKVHIMVCDNGSSDATAEVVEDLARNNSDIEVTVIDESNAGKIHAIRTLLDELVASRANVRRVVFVDADVTWDQEVLVKLWEHMEKNTDIILAGANIRPREDQESNPGFFSNLSRIPWYGYGSYTDEGFGKFNRVCSTMTYMARWPEIFSLHNKYSTIGAEAVNLTESLETHQINIVEDAIARENSPGSWNEMKACHGRHIIQHAANLRVFEEEEFAALLYEHFNEGEPSKEDLEALRKSAKQIAKQRYSRVFDNRIPNVLCGLFTSSRSLRSGVKAWFADIPIFNMPFFLTLLGLVGAPILYGYLKIRARSKQGDSGTVWDPVGPSR